MSSFSFIHTADLHLDSPFSALRLEHPELASRLRSATFEAFDRIIALCIEKAVDFLLVAGDIYDGTDRSLRAQVRFRDGLGRLLDAGIESFVVHGNHDPLDSWSSSLDWPEGVHIFGDRIETLEVRRKGELLACIQGLSYPKREERRNLAHFFKRESEAFQIGLLHANVGSGTGHEPYAPCSLEDLFRSGMDYWALGHVHQKRTLSHGPPFILYPGNTQGRNIRETGEKGCYLVRVGDDRGVEAQFFATDVVRWGNLEVPIKNLLTEQDLMNALDRSCREVAETSSGRPAIVRVHLTGPGPLYPILQKNQTVPDLIEITQDLGLSFTPPVYVEQLRSRVRPESDLNTWSEKEDFLGELLRTSGELSKNTHIRELLEPDLSPLFQDPRVRKFIETPDGAKLRELLRRAEELCADRLGGEAAE
ncbi:MAG: DNA repair exonuclease [Pseudomonadota bacterium]